MCNNCHTPLYTRYGIIIAVAAIIGISTPGTVHCYLPFRLTLGFRLELGWQYAKISINRNNGIKHIMPTLAQSVVVALF